LQKEKTMIQIVNAHPGLCLVAAIWIVCGIVDLCKGMGALFLAMIATIGWGFFHLLAK
jgi:hypothetical protein